LERLQLDYVDVLQCRFIDFRSASFEAKRLNVRFLGHRFDKDTPIAETVRESMSEVDGILISCHV
jgi:hypothetical protein